MTKTWQQDLVDLHPELFVGTFRAVPFSPGHPSTCGDGWRDIVAKLVERVSAAATEYPIQFTQIREVHGRLAIHWRAEAALPKHVEYTIEESIARAEARSACSCMVCGANARLFSSGGQLHTACPNHAQGVPVPVPPGMEDLHIVRAFAGDEFHSVVCRRYDRDRDRFVDIDLSSVGIGHWREILAHVGNPGGITGWPNAPSIKPP
jgi:hypothetical protein